MILDDILKEVVDEVSLLEGDMDRHRLIHTLYYYIARHITEYSYWDICNHVGIKYNSVICVVPPKYLDVIRRIIIKFRDC